MPASFWNDPTWFAIARLIVKREAHEMEDPIFHRPILVNEVVELLAPRAGALVVDGHTEAILRTGANVLALDQDPDAISYATEHLSRFGSRVTFRQANFRDAARVLDALGIGG